MTKTIFQKKTLLEISYRLCKQKPIDIIPDYPIEKISNKDRQFNKEINVSEMLDLLIFEIMDSYNNYNLLPIYFSADCLYSFRDMIIHSYSIGEISDTERKKREKIIKNKAKEIYILRNDFFKYLKLASKGVKLKFQIDTIMKELNINFDYPINVYMSHSDFLCFVNNYIEKYGGSEKKVISFLSCSPFDRDEYAPGLSLFIKETYNTNPFW